MRKNKLLIVVLSAVFLTGCISAMPKINNSNTLTSNISSSETNSPSSINVPIVSSGTTTTTSIIPSSSSISSISSSSISIPSHEDEDKDYYVSISENLTGNELLDALRTLNKRKLKSTVGYGAMGTNVSGQFKYTDYDPASVQYDENGQPYGTKCLSFYSGNTTTSWNREHVWPDTHGGHYVESDIHMVRPTIPAENGSRGHSFYIEGKKTKTNEGWDPAMESFGKENYRGDCARIVFYCMVAISQLTLVDDASRSAKTKNCEMGVISDMLSWNLRYAVLQREQNRNDGAEYLQGNRNPFIDHPEYACRIWGGFNNNTRQICGM